ncbi:MAG: hypothetical protein KA055_01570, partial [Aliarcobacter sp.]|nr:hypothetical protein [Aliarcobacter sp.]
NIEGFFNEDIKIENPSTKIVYDAEKLVESKSDVIFRVSALVGANRLPGRRFSGKVLEYPKTKINFVHRADVISATKYIIDNDLNGIFNLCSKEHPTKEDLYIFNAKKYNFEPPISCDNNESLNRLIDGSKISKQGFVYKYNSAFDLD